MAYNFTTASTQYLINSVFPALNLPITVACWFKTPLLTTQRVLVQLANASTAAVYRLVIPASSQKLRILASNGANGLATSLTDIPQNIWGHACAVVTSTSSRSIYLNGLFEITNTVSVNHFTIDRITIGANITNASQGAYFAGDICEVGVWNTALTNSEIASLGKGIACNKVRPQSLIFYSPLIRNLIDSKGGLNITNNNGAIIANHPRIYT